MIMPSYSPSCFLDTGSFPLFVWLLARSYVFWLGPTTGCFFTGSVLKVISMELVPTNRGKNTGLAMQASSQRFLGQASAGASSAWMGEASVFFFAILRKLAKCQKGFFILRSQTHHLFSCSPPSTCADTSSTIASLVTFSTPSPAEGLLLRKSWTVPCFLNFFKSLVHDCHRLGGGACCLGWPPDDENPVKETKCWWLP